MGGGGGGGLLDFRVYLSPLLGEGVRSRIERCSREGSREGSRDGREREREGRVREGEGRDEKGEERDCDNYVTRMQTSCWFVDTQ